MPHRDDIPRKPRHTGVWYQIIALLLHASTFLPSTSPDPARNAFIYHVPYMSNINGIVVAVILDLVLVAILMRGLFGESIRVKCRQKALVGCAFWWLYQLGMSVAYDGYWQYDAALVTFLAMSCITLWVDVERKPRREEGGA